VLQPVQCQNDGEHKQRTGQGEANTLDKDLRRGFAGGYRRSTKDRIAKAAEDEPDKRTDKRHVGWRQRFTCLDGARGPVGLIVEANADQEDKCGEAEAGQYTRELGVVSCRRSDVERDDRIRRTQVHIAAHLISFIKLT
jgi:hypothetical protein